jgi:Protein kinase domain
MALLRSREAYRVWERLLACCTDMVDVIHFTATVAAFSDMIAPQIVQTIKLFSRLRSDAQGAVTLGGELEQFLSKHHGWNGQSFDRQVSAVDLLSSLKSFRVVSEQNLGRGAYARVYLARNQLTGATVVHKHVLLDSPEHGMPLHVLRELALLKKMKHPHIVRCGVRRAQACFTVCVEQRHQLLSPSFRQ